MGLMQLLKYPSQKITLNAFSDGFSDGNKDPKTEVETEGKEEMKSKFCTVKRDLHTLKGIDNFFK